MKKILLIVSIVMSVFVMQAQPGTISLNLDAGYTFGSRVNFDLLHTEVQGAFQYGGGIEYFAGFSNSVEMKYLRMDTQFPLYTDGGIQLNTAEASKGSINFILLGGNSYLNAGFHSKVMPFGGLSAGVGILNIDGSSATKFAFDAKVGVKIKTSSVVSFKLQAYLQSIISTFGTDVWVGAGGYAYTVPDYASLWQFGLGGVICFDFQKK